LQSLANELSADAILKFFTPGCNLKTGQQFPGFDNCYTITEIQQKYNISSGALSIDSTQGIVNIPLKNSPAVSNRILI
jgi:hypothetical protein